MNPDFQLKYLDTLQSIINRQAGNSFLIKGWVITISLAGFGLFATTSNKLFLLLSVFSTSIFWILDAYYLQQEKLFRKLYEKVTESILKKKHNIPKLFSTDTSGHRKDVPNLMKLMLSFPTRLVYLAILIVTVLLYFY